MCCQTCVVCLALFRGIQQPIVSTRFGNDADGCPIGHTLSYHISRCIQFSCQLVDIVFI